MEIEPGKCTLALLIVRDVAQEYVIAMIMIIVTELINNR